MLCIICESSAYQKKYRCPYCDKRAERMDLVNHIDENHSDMIPKGYTSTRLVFNMINKKEHGSCVICGKETKWDEEKARYDRFCGSKRCHDQYVKTAHKNTNIEEKLRDPEFQQKMLAGRSISGTYKFSDGGKVSYTGSYEKNLLEFLDKILHVKSYDIIAPGPVIEYEFDGKTHFWITDLIYLPYNLVFDVKDGGDNPNRREMTSYREKQIAKEEAIRKQGKYNYIRLTDNKFEQLIEVMLMIKETLVDDNKPQIPIIKINEHSTMAISALPPSNNQNVYIVHYKNKNSFIGNDDNYALCKDYMQDTVTVNNGEFNIIPFEDLKEMNIRVFKYKKDANFIDTLENSNNGIDFYKNLTGKDLLDLNQLEFDNLFEEVTPYTDLLSIMEGIITESIKNKLIGQTDKSALVEGISIPYFELEHLNKGDYNIKFYRDMDGVFLMKEDSCIRTKSYKDIKYLEDHLREIANIME